MKKLVFPVLLMLVASLSACAGSPPSSAPASPSASKSAEPKAASLTLYADFSNGAADGEVKEKQITLPSEGEPASRSVVASALADGLTEWTGLEFMLNDVTFPDDESVRVDWSKESTLIAGMGKREFKNDFRFSDAVSLNWFMMDSLATTLKKSMDVKVVYYQSDGQPITFTNPEEMAAQGLPDLPIDQAYEGSAFFVSHAGEKGEEEPADGGDGRGDKIPDSDEPEDNSWETNQTIVEGIVFKGSMLKTDPGENLTPFDAAKGLYNLVLKKDLKKGKDYSAQTPVNITCVDVIAFDGKELYLLSVNGPLLAVDQEYAVEYDRSSQNVYLISEEAPKLLGSLRSLK